MNRGLPGGRKRWLYTWGNLMNAEAHRGSAEYRRGVTVQRRQCSPVTNDYKRHNA